MTTKDKPLYHKIADQLAAQIDSGRYPPGSRLPAERELAEQFAVSRVTIREAEIALQALGRISIKTGSGVYVEEPAPTSDSAFPDISAFELTEARALFESEAAALAAEQMTDGTLEILEKYVDVMSQPDIDTNSQETADQDFHRTIAAASNNAAIVFVIEQLWSMRDEIAEVKTVHESVCKTDRRALGDEHRAILEALRARDAGAARTAMRDHFRRLIESMLDVTHEQAVEELRRQSSESRKRYLKTAGL